VAGALSHDGKDGIIAENRSLGAAPRRCAAAHASQACNGAAERARRNE
jgi:hypothetical protein